MATLNFPSSPSNGDIHTHDGKQWQYVSADTKWIAYGASLAPDVLKVDAANNRVGINQTSPSYGLDVTGTARVTGVITASGGVVGNVTGNTSGTSGSTTGNAATATILANARTIGGVSFNGSAAIVPATITVADTTDTSCSVGLWESATGDLAPKSDAGVTYNAGTGTLTATAFAGPLTGNVTGNASGTSGSTTGNAATATALATARTIGGVSFDGTANIAVTLAATATALATARTIGGTSFDGTANIAVGLAATATALATGRTIGGVSFDGTANITLPGVNATGNQNTSGTAATVTGAAQTAITSVGTLTSLTVSGGLVAPLAINTPTASYTLVAADAGKLIEMNVGSTNTLTIPTHSGDGNSVAFATGTQIVVVQLGAGVTTLAGASGVGLNSKDDNKVIDGQYAAVTLIKKGTNDWWLFGALTS